MKLKFLHFIFVLLLLSPLSSYGATKENVSMADKMLLAQTPLILNGLGVRRATWFKVKVYVGGLYLKEKSKETKKILSMPYPKFMRMTFVRNVDKKDLSEGWEDGFKAALGKEGYKTFASQILQFKQTMGDIKKGQSIEISFLQKGAEVIFNGQKKGLIAGADFAGALLSVWFVNPKDEGLRDGLLGL